MKIEKFENIIADITSKYSKIAKELYSANGQHSIVDQGKNFIGGYTNDTNLVFQNTNPVIVFGDHTRIFKYVDFPFAIGADGVKVLNVDTQKAFPKYVYYFLKNAKLPDAGYSRHFKFLKELEFPVPENIVDQIKIAKLLDKIEILITKREESIELLDAFLSNTFLKLFGNPLKNEKGWDTKPLGETTIKITDGEHLSPKTTHEGFHLIMAKDVLSDNVDFSQNTFVSESDFQKFTKKCNPENGDVLLVSRGATIGRCVVVNVDRQFCLMGSVILIKPNINKLTGTFINYLFKNDHFKQKLVVTSSSSAQQAIYISGLKSVNTIVPSLEVQNIFSDIVIKTEHLKRKLNESLIEIRNLNKSLSQKAFSGKLDLSKFEIEEEWHNFEGNEPEEKDPIKRAEIKQYFEDQLKKIEEGDFDKPIGDPFEVDEETAKKQGKQFYKEWKKLHPVKRKSKITWEKVSTQQAANWIKEKYSGYHFTSEMLIRFLMDEYVTFPDYYSSEELKKYPQTNEADDLKSLIFSAVSKQNPYLKLEQVFYNAEEENIQIKITAEDYELIKERSPKNRSGIYFTITE